MEVVGADPALVATTAGNHIHAVVPDLGAGLTAGTAELRVVSEATQGVLQGRALEIGTKLPA